jgi:hypothetical protein
MNSPSRATVALLLAIACGLVLASPAAAAITSSQISSPSSPTYSVFDHDAPNTIAVSGTTNSSAPGTDKVDLDCFHGTTETQLAANVSLDGSGGFSVPAAALANLSEQTCRLRAVPAGTVPTAAELAKFAGPVLATGLRSTSWVNGNPAEPIVDFGVTGQALSAADQFHSLSACGLGDATLLDPSFEVATVTFYCHDSLRKGEGENEASSTRSEVRVDNADAYARSAAISINPNAKPPGFSYSYSQDPASGDVTVTDSEELGKCPSAAYPPTEASCQTFLGTGVRDERTIEQTEGGHLVYVSDRFVSTDGQSHSLDLLPQNEQHFGGPSVSQAQETAYRFPGQSSFSTFKKGEAISFGGEAPATTYIRHSGAPDGDPATGQGAIVVDRAASPATFNSVDGTASSFCFHETATVPAGGATTVRTAYVQGYDSGEVETLAHQAEAAFRPPPSPPPLATVPSNRFRIGRRQVNRRKGSVRLILIVPGPGTVELRGKKVRAVRHKVKKAGRTAVTVRPKRMQLKILKHRHREHVRFKLTYTPTGGYPRHKTIGLTLIHR